GGGAGGEFPDGQADATDRAGVRRGGEAVMAPPCRVTVATAPQPGAVGLLQLHGPGAAVLAAALCDRPLPGAGRAGLRDLGGIDEGLAAALREDWGQLMPHGGPRVVQRLVERLVELGAVYETE